jgi:hypothetical protein
MSSEPPEFDIAQSSGGIERGSFNRCRNVTREHLLIVRSVTGEIGSYAGLSDGDTSQFLKEPPHAGVPRIDGLTEHHRASADNAIDPEFSCEPDRLIRDASRPEGSVKPYLSDTTLGALADYGRRKPGMRRDDNPVNVHRD